MDEVDSNLENNRSSESEIVEVHNFHLEEDGRLRIDMRDAVRGTSSYIER